MTARARLRWRARYEWWRRQKPARQLPARERARLASRRLAAGARTALVKCQKCTDAWKTWK